MEDPEPTEVKTGESGDTPNMEHKSGTPELSGNRKRKLQKKVGKKKEKKMKKEPSEMVKLRRKYAAQKMLKPKTWDEAKTRYRREMADLPAAHRHKLIVSRVPGFGGVVSWLKKENIEIVQLKAIGADYEIETVSEVEDSTLEKLRAKPLGKSWLKSIVLVQAMRNGISSPPKDAFLDEKLVEIADCLAEQEEKWLARNMKSRGEWKTKGEKREMHADGYNKNWGCCDSCDEEFGNGGPSPNYKEYHKYGSCGECANHYVEKHAFPSTSRIGAIAKKTIDAIACSDVNRIPRLRAVTQLLHNIDLYVGNHYRDRLADIAKLHWLTHVLEMSFTVFDMERRQLDMATVLPEGVRYSGKLKKAAEGWKSDELQKILRGEPVKFRDNYDYDYKGYDYEGEKEWEKAVMEGRIEVLVQKTSVHEALFLSRHIKDRNYEGFRRRVLPKYPGCTDEFFCEMLKLYMEPLKDYGDFRNEKLCLVLVPEVPDHILEKVIGHLNSLIETRKEAAIGPNFLASLKKLSKFVKDRGNSRCSELLLNLKMQVFELSPSGDSSVLELLLDSALGEWDVRKIIAKFTSMTEQGKGYETYSMISVLLKVAEFIKAHGIASCAEEFTQLKMQVFEDHPCETLTLLLDTRLLEISDDVLGKIIKRFTCLNEPGKTFESCMVDRVDRLSTFVNNRGNSSYTGEMITLLLQVFTQSPVMTLSIMLASEMPEYAMTIIIAKFTSMTEQDKTVNSRRSVSKAVRELSVYVKPREYSDFIKDAVKILEFRMLLDQFDPPCGGLNPLLVKEVPEDIISRVIDRLVTASEPGKKYDTLGMVSGLKNLSAFIKDCDRSSSSVEAVMKVMLRVYKNVTRKLSELGNPDLRICLDKEYRRLLESLGKCGHEGCTWYKEFCTFLGSDELKKEFGMNDANKRCLLNSLCAGVAGRLLVSFAAPPWRKNAGWGYVTITKKAEYKNRVLHVERVNRDFIAAEKTLAEQMTKLKPDWRSALLDDEQNNNPNETADGIPIIDLDDD